MPQKMIDVTLVCDTSILADGDVICATAEIPNAVADSGGSATLDSVLLIDEDDQGVQVDLVFLRSNVSLGTVNGAPNISDANSRELLGFVEVFAADYSDYGGVQIASLHDIRLQLSPLVGTSLFVSAISRGGTPTYTASGLKLRLGFC